MLYAVKKQEDGIHLYIARKDEDKLFLVEDLVDVVQEINMTGILRRFDTEEWDAKNLYEMTEDELVEECDLFNFQEAALACVAREIEKEKRENQ